ncbi:ribonuclease VapC [Sphingomonas faeni]|uniref:Ribonuclease VapC n=1 Tax=Sphingomonas faeni TaxID=185950 RepID=A0A2T5U7Q8_9SPHN|nr:ribonuclease VapC [Sphingomonas faeni]
MTVFVDASALVAIITGEPERDAFITRVEHDGNALWSAMSCWETVSALRSSYRFDIDVARSEVENTAQVLALRIIAIGESELSTALDAYQIYGKGRHPAKLNMGDCFAYACAKTHGAELLYKGNDFALTDLA